MVGRLRLTDIPRLLAERSVAVHSFFVTNAAFIFSDILGNVFPVNEPGAEESGLDLAITDLPVFNAAMHKKQNVVLVN